MSKKLLETQKAYLAGFLDGDGSIYVRAKPNPTYRYGFQIAPYIVLFQSAKDKDNFAKLYSLVEGGHLRKRKDGILEYILSKKEDILWFLNIVKPYVVLKKKHIILLEKILKLKENVKNISDFQRLLKAVNSFGNINYSKKRKRRVLTP